jgi:hypothetical protein
MARLISLRRFRCSRVLEVVAACLIVLGVSPFTAPFASVDLAGLLAGRAVGEGTCSASAIKDLTDDPIFAAPFRPQLGSETFLDVSVSGVIRLSALRTIVLRI